MKNEDTGYVAEMPSENKKAPQLKLSDIIDCYSQFLSYLLDQCNLLMLRK